jgi:predicted lipoprotein with Yx(FWY)xxD motif
MRKTDKAAIRRAGWIAVIAAGAGLSGIAAATAAPVARRAAATTVTTHHTKHGKVLAAANGHTLYMFAIDKAAKSSCYGSCAAVWPPLLTTGRPVAAKGSGVNSKLLGTTRRKDGKLEVTYNGHPLYRYAPDTKPGQTNGEGANQFHGRWWVLNTSGNAVKTGGGKVCNPLCPGY